MATRTSDFPWEKVGKRKRRRRRRRIERDRRRERR